MTLAERKQVILDYLEHVTDTRIWDQIEELLGERISCCQSDVLCFTPEMKIKLERALDDMKVGRISTDEEMQKRFAKWLKVD